MRPWKNLTRFNTKENLATPKKNHGKKQVLNLHRLVHLGFKNNRKNKNKQDSLVVYVVCKYLFVGQLVVSFPKRGVLHSFGFRSFIAKLFTSCLFILKSRFVQGRWKLYPETYKAIAIVQHITKNLAHTAAKCFGVAVRGDVITYIDETMDTTKHNNVHACITG